ncbi:MAG: hypothetical protein NC395_08150 [Prevotella sp.]|nr:hypothetical protein [Prevotella sp.]
MKKNLEEIRDELITETETAKAISEVMILLRTGVYGFEQHGVGFETVQNAFGLMAEVSETHANKLDILTDDLTDLQNDLKLK